MAYGAEFCPRRLPPLADVVAVAQGCAAMGRGFSLVTPVLREGVLAALMEYLGGFAAQVPDAECVCNDWGLLQWAAAERLPLRLGAGRLLGRQRRGPRVLQLTAEAAPDEALALRGSAWNDPVNVELLLELGIGRVELDFLLQGTARPHLPQGIDLTVCAPWIPVTVTPSCDYAEDPLHCARECQRCDAVRRENDQDPHPLWSRGNTLFARSELNPPYQAASKLGADRLVWAEVLPG
ncbi:MAG TPA: hypothetical protein VK997_05820 [Deferrisomatales bacterium]|nr:hypothetical protein [Deferrisomatales bacterium]